ncbi:hypothetical protein G6F68_017672 [Rhizopus microsporus]|nr:hypothetical protein G6F68_017672 [Rhizopus microsporus]
MASPGESQTTQRARGGPHRSGKSHHVRTTIRQCLVAGLCVCTVRAGLHADLRRARGDQPGAWRRLHGWRLRGTVRRPALRPAPVGCADGRVLRGRLHRGHHRLSGAQAPAQAQRAAFDPHDRHDWRGHHPE